MVFVRKGFLVHSSIWLQICDFSHGDSFKVSVVRLKETNQWSAEKTIIRLSQRTLNREGVIFKWHQIASKTYKGTTSSKFKYINLLSLLKGKIKNGLSRTFQNFRLSLYNLFVYVQIKILSWASCTIMKGTCIP